MTAPLARYATTNCTADTRRQHQLRAAGYRVVSADGDCGGVWLVGKRGSSWFPSLAAAWQAVRRGCALAEVERRK